MNIDSSNAHPLPDSVTQIANLIGRDKALYLIGKLSKLSKRPREVSLYIPKKLKSHHKLVDIIGYEDTHKLVNAYGGEILCIASCHSLVRHYRNEYLKHLKLISPEKASQIDIASLSNVFGISKKQARNLMEKPPEEILPHSLDTQPYP
jgi:hypothetical protein